uniref:Uncharacterized protein n=1 Tax=Arundo donax TaxID=35708 RepID=A0A0A9B9S7_ARUDO
MSKMVIINELDDAMISAKGFPDKVERLLKKGVSFMYTSWMML